MVQPQSASDPLIGEVIANRYRIESRVGEGAMGVVYRARHIKVGRAFAVKVLHARLLDDKKVAERFEREAELAGRLRHPNVIGVVDVGETQGTRYMVMDFAEGQDLANLLSEAPFPYERVVTITRALCEGLFHAHEQGLIHRDFKPENVIIEREGDVEVPRIVDFGIAILREAGDSSQSPGRLTTNGLVLGTPHYMAPEQAVADPIDHRIDLFALGIMMYEMLCGKLPFDGSGAEVARANLMLDPPLIAQRVPFLEVDPLLEALSRRLMSKQRDMRPPTARAARELLDLIDRDREAAAALLGVPLTPAIGSRAPTFTAPMSPTREEKPSEPPPFSEATADAAAEYAVAMPTPAPLADVVARPLVAVGPASRGPRAHIETDVVRPPRAPGKGVVIGLLAAAGVLGVGLVVALNHGGDSKQPSASTDTKRVEMTAQPIAPTPTAPAPAPKPPDPTPIDTAATPAELLPHPDPVTTPPAQAPTPPPRQVTVRPVHQTNTTKQVAVASVTSTPQPAVTPQPTATQPTTPQPTQPTTTQPPATTLTGGQLGAMYGRVGNEIGRLQDQQGSEVTSDLWAALRRYDINVEMKASPERLAEVARALDAIHRKVVQRTKKVQ